MLYRLQGVQQVLGGQRGVEQGDGVQVIGLGTRARARFAPYPGEVFEGQLTKQAGVADKNNGAPTVQISAPETESEFAEATADEARALSGIWTAWAELEKALGQG